MPDIRIADFTPGLLTALDPIRLPAGAAQVADNVLVERGDVRVRPGRTLAARCPSGTTGGVRTLGELVVAGHAPVHRFIGIIGTKVYWSVDGTTGTTRANGTAYTLGQVRTVSGSLYECTTAGTSAGSPPTFNATDGATTTDGTVVWTRRAVPVFQEVNPAAAIAVHASNTVRMHQYADKLYIADGYNPVRQMDADGNFNTLVDFLGPKVAPTAVPDLVSVTIDSCEDTLVVDGYSSQTGRRRGYRRKWTMGQTPPFGNYYFLIDNYAAGDNNQGLYQDGAYCWRAYTGDAGIGNDPFNPGPMQGMTARLLLDSANVVGTRNSSIALELCEADGAGTNTLDAGDVTFSSHCAPQDWTSYGTISFSLRVISGGSTIPATVKFFYREGTATATEIDVPLTIAGGATADLTNALTEWSATLTLTEMNAPAASRNAVTEYGFYFPALSLDATTRKETSVPNLFANPNDYAMALADNGATTGAAYIVFGPITATVTGTDTHFTSGTYEFTYTYYTDTDESSEYISADFEAPYPSLVIGAALPKSIIITATKDAGSTALGARFYARTPTTGSALRRIGEMPFSGNTTAILVWDGDVGAAAEFLEGYVGAPPIGASLLITYNNRMVYVAIPPTGAWEATTAYHLGDIYLPTTRNGHAYRVTTAGTTGSTEPTWTTTNGGTNTDGTVTWTCQAMPAADVLYFSNFGDPTRVPTKPDALQTVPATYGGWADLERFGNDVTGLGVLGPMLLAFKVSSTFAVSGDPGQPDFLVQEVTRRDGCLSHESIQPVGGLLVWQARDKVLAWDGAAIQDISEGIAPTVQVVSDTLQARAYGICDPQTRRYLLFSSEAGETNGGVVPEGTALVWQLRGENPAWCRWTKQPNACGLYSAHASTPGVYLADTYSGVGKVFLVNDTATTDAVNSGDAEPIAWLWVSGEMALPEERRGLELVEVRAKLVVSDGVGPFTALLGFYPNNAAVSVVSRAATARALTAATSNYTGIAVWQPAPREIESCAVLVGRTADGVTSLRELTAVLQPRGVIR